VSQKGTGESVAQLFAALANADRLAILSELRRQEGSTACGHSISEVAARTGLTRFSASRHLRILADVSLTYATRNRRTIIYRLNVYAFEQVEDWAIAYTEEFVSKPPAPATSIDLGSCVGPSSASTGRMRSSVGTIR